MTSTHRHEQQQAEEQLDALLDYLLSLRAKIGLGRDLSPDDLLTVREWWETGFGAMTNVEGL